MNKWGEYPQGSPNKEFKILTEVIGKIQMVNNQIKIYYKMNSRMAFIQTNPNKL